MKEREVLDGIELPDDMPRLSDTDLFTNTRNWHPRLESLDRMITEFDYADYLWDGRRDEFMQESEKIKIPQPKNKI